MVTKRRVKKGLEQGLVKIIKEPYACNETVCRIGNAWFYFGTMETRQEKPENILRDVDGAADSICKALEGFRWKTKKKETDDYKYIDGYLSTNAR